MLTPAGGVLHPDWHAPSPQMRQRLHACILPQRFCPPSPCLFGIKYIQCLQQEHGTRIIEAPHCATPHAPHVPHADGCHTKVPFVACAVRTADCLPVFLCDAAAKKVAVIHAGWRGLVAGILDNLAQRVFGQPADSANRIHAAFGAAISRKHFEVGEDVYRKMKKEDRQHLKASSVPARWYADLYAIASARLAAQNILVGKIPAWCTYEQANLFPSYRRDSGYGKPWQKIFNLVWLTNA